MSTSNSRASAAVNARSLLAPRRAILVLGTEREGSADRRACLRRPESRREGARLRTRAGRGTPGPRRDERRRGRSKAVQQTPDPRATRAGPARDRGRAFPESLPRCFRRRVCAVDRLRHVGPEADRVVVSRVEREPGNGVLRALHAPGCEQRRLAVPRRRAHERQLPRGVGVEHREQSGAFDETLATLRRRELHLEHA